MLWCLRALPGEVVIELAPSSPTPSKHTATVIFTPADFPDNCRVFPLSPSGAQATRPILSVTRPDVSIIDSAADLSSTDWLLVSGPEFAADIHTAQTKGWHNPILILPEICTSYYDFWSFPTNILRNAPNGELSVELHDFESFIAVFGDFFGQNVAGHHEPAPYRYMALQRATAADADTQVSKVLNLLADDASRTDYLAVLKFQPRELWHHWLRGLYNGLEYMDYVSLTPGNVVLNCGVHGGGEIPYFLAALSGKGGLVNIDPLGHTYLSDFVRASIAGSAVDCQEVPAALDQTEGTIEMHVEPGGMASGSPEALHGREVTQFRATTIDQIARDLALNRIDLIKMDIEGAEPNALAGAWAAIERFRPQLAISIYHTPDQFLEIPLLLASHLKNYSLFVRNYHFISNETILYAIPWERPIKARRDPISVRLMEPISDPAAGNVQGRAAY